MSGSRARLLTFSSLSISFGPTAVLDDLTLDLGVGITAVLGVNGAGKTTLLHTAAGALRPCEGAVRIGGDDPYARASRRRALSRVALIPQFLEFPRHLRVADYLDYMAMIRAVPAHDRARAGRQALVEVDLADRLRSRLGSLSGGMLKRLAIAQALLTTPRVLLCDEPTVGLDPEQRASVRELLKRLAADRCLVLTSHIVEDAVYLADRVVVLHARRIAYDGTVDDLVGRSGSPGAEILGSDLEHAFLRIVRGTPA